MFLKKAGYTVKVEDNGAKVTATDDGYCFYVDDASLEFFPYEKE